MTCHLANKARLAASAGAVLSLRQWSPARCETPAFESKRPERLFGKDGPNPPAASSSHPFTLDSSTRCVSSKRPRVLAEPVRLDCGEDAFFMAKATERHMMLGLADGVSSWARMGIDSALFAWELMNSCEAAVASKSDSGPCKVMDHGYRDMLAKGKSRYPFGSSTACTASLNRLNGGLDVANLGDSGALLLRPPSNVATAAPAVGFNLGQSWWSRRAAAAPAATSTSSAVDVVLATQEQQHSFNCPYQLMLSPQNGEGDTPSLCNLYHKQVEDGDLLILGTDGFFDNVWRERILEVVSAMRGASPGEIAEALVRIAYEKSLSHDWVPFSETALQAGFDHRGGKPDDITVIVARVARRRDAQA